MPIRDIMKPILENNNVVILDILHWSQTFLRFIEVI